MTAASFWHTWVWPAGGSGGIPGDVVGSLVWAVAVGTITILLWPRLRRAAERFVKRHAEDVKTRTEADLAELHRKLDHIIKHHPAIPPLASQPPRPTPPEA